MPDSGDLAESGWLVEEVGKIAVLAELSYQRLMSGQRCVSTLVKSNGVGLNFSG